MKNELQKKLFEKYPNLFAQRTLPMSQTCLCWGIETADGWADLIDAMCSFLKWDIEHNSHVYPKLEFTQVKEKFGTLRVYYNIMHRTKEEYNELKKEGLCDNRRGIIPFFSRLSDKLFGTNFGYRNYIEGCHDGASRMEGAIEFAEYLSGVICEECGGKGKLWTDGWHATLCDKCHKRRKKKAVKWGE